MPTSLSELIDERKKDIYDSIAAARIGSAIKKMIDFYRDFFPAKEEEAIKLSRRWNELTKRRVDNTISYEEAGRETNRITEAIFEKLREAMEIAQSENMDTPSLLGDAEKLTALLAEQLRQREVPDDVVVKIKDLHKYYRSTGFHLQAEQLELRLGEITGLVGENATGKTTLFRILAGDLAHDKGLLEYPQWQDGKSYNWSFLKKKIAYLPQQVPRWYGSLVENLKYEAAINGIKGAQNEKELEYIIQRLGLEEHRNKTWIQLSGGYKLRFALARALIKKPQLLVLDEPLANLDIKTQVIVLNDLQNLCKSLRNPLAVIISSQHIEEVEAVADQMLYMTGGNLVDLGASKAYGEDRRYNVFELSCACTFAELKQLLDDFPYQRLWYNGMHFFITTDLATSSFQLLGYLEKNKMPVRFFADISTSIKTKFYESYL